MPSTRERAVAEALAAVFDLTTRTSEAVAPALDAHGLTFNTAYALWVLDPDEPAPSMREVAERMHCTPSNLTFLATTLERQGLIRRTPAPADRRQRVVELTDAGREARETVVAAFLTSCPLGDLSDEELSDLLRLTRRALST